MVTLVRKVADGGAVELFLGAEGDGHLLVQVSRPWVTEQTLGRLVDSCADVLIEAQHPELISPRSLHVSRAGRWMAFTDSVTGWTGADFLRREGRLDEGLVLDWAVTVCEALEVLHARGHTHGCLAPRHLHLFGDARFPSARLFDTTLLHLRSEVPNDIAIVEPHSLAPERASGRRGTHRSDVWGIGALIVELLTGLPLSGGRTTDERRASARSARAPRLPAALAHWQPLVDTCLEPLPVNRFATALEVRQALLNLA